MINKNIFFRNILLFVFTLSSMLSFGQINILRYNDNFSILKKDTTKTGYNSLKEIRIGKNNFISFGGELREQYQYFENSNFGDVPPTFKNATFNQIWHRVMLHSNIELGEKTRVFVQLNSTFRFFNDNPLTPEIDENRLSLHQAFIDYSFAKNWLMRIGRQEMGYGNNRMLTFREGPNTRLTYDAVLVKHSTRKRKIDFIALTPVISRNDVFDDQSFKDVIVGIYITENLIAQKLLLDYYFINFKSNQRRYNFINDDENRQSYGFRIFSNNPTLNYEIESTYQSGKFVSKKISAFGLSTDLNFLISAKKKIIIGFGANYFTGDKSKTDNKLNTYNLIFSKPSYGLAAPIGSSNIINVNPYIKITPLKEINIYTGVYIMGRQSNQDGTYSPGMAQVRPNVNNLFGTTKKRIGLQYALEASFQLNANFSFALDGAYFKAGKYVRETGKGKDIKYVSCKATFEF